MAKNDKRLIGIKAIADYLNTSERNVYRWEKKFGLPLRRVAGSKGHSVYVYLSDLEEWLTQRSSSRVHDKKNIREIVARSALVILTLIIVIVITVFIVNSRNKHELNSLIFSRNSPNPQFFAVDGNFVFVKNLDSENIWFYTDSNRDVSSKDWDRLRCVDFADVDKDGFNEVFARTYNSSEDRYYLTFFNNDKKILWQRQINNTQKFNGLNLESNFFPIDVRLASLHDTSFYIVTHWRHRVRFLSVISSHNTNGELLSKYIHVGHLGPLEVHDLNSDGNEEIIFSGTNNLLNGEGVVGVLDLKDFKGVSPPYQIEPEYKHLSNHLQIYVPDEPQQGNQIFYLRFKRTNHFKDFQNVHIFAELNNFDNGIIHIQVNSWALEFLGQQFGFVYVLDNRFNLKYTFANSSMLKFYPDLLKKQEIEIGLDELLNIYSKNIWCWENGNWIPLYKKH